MNVGTRVYDKVVARVYRAIAAGTVTRVYDNDTVEVQWDSAPIGCTDSEDTEILGEL